MYLLYKEGDRCYRFKVDDNTDFENINIEDGEDVTDSDLIEKEVLMRLLTCDSMIIGNSKYTDRCLEENRPLYAVLDDMAQIIGRRALIVPYKRRSMTSALKIYSGAMVRVEGKDGFAVTVGRDPEEAYVAFTVLEKSAEVYLKAFAIGGPERIDQGLCHIMRLKYLNHYSQRERRRIHGEEA